MMRLAKMDVCSGCTACQSICPATAIAMVADHEGFLYPRIDESKCVKCGLCRKVCPSLNRGRPRTPINVYAAKAKNDDLRMKSSSGGVFSLLARWVFARRGIVYGAGFDYGDWHVKHIAAESEEGLGNIRGSKYVQSDIQGVFWAVKTNLDKGREVLFSGTPCQVAALRRCLGKEYDNLLCVDVVCHAVPSPMAWEKYLDCREDALAGRHGSALEGRNIRGISFRCKNYGWKRFSVSLRFAYYKEYLADLHTDTFMRGFLHELYNRPSCYDCQCREFRSGADLTIADYWGIGDVHPALDDDKGVSAVFVNTKRGGQMFDNICHSLVFEKSSFEEVVRCNPAAIKNLQPNRRRAEFFRSCSSISFDKLVLHLLRPSFPMMVGRVCLAFRRIVGRGLRAMGVRK